MIHKASKLALAAAAALCLPAAAQAGTSTDTKAANFTVLNQCSITGANIDLGTFTAQQTWGDLGASIGHLNLGTNAYTPGSRGGASMKLGSVNCDWDVLYTLYIQGSSNDPQANKAIQLTVGGKPHPSGSTSRRLEALISGMRIFRAGVLALVRISFTGSEVQRQRTLRAMFSF